MLAVDFDELFANFFEQGDANRCIVDEGAAFAIGQDDAAEDERIGSGKAMCLEEPRRVIEFGGDAALGRAVAQQSWIVAIA